MKRIFITCSLLFLALTVFVAADTWFNESSETETKTVSKESINKAEDTTSQEALAETEKTGKLIDVPAICQYPELPTGCESASATGVLQYYNVNISATEFASDWLSCNEDFYRINGALYGPDPNRVFAGNPFSSNAYGCFAGPIADAINRNSDKLYAQIITDRTIEELCADYIDNDRPILIWATIGMKESYNGNSWLLENGVLFTWIAGEHCLILVGYNDDFYYLNDPTSGSTVAYQKQLVEKRFDELGKQAVLILPKHS